MRTGTDEGVVLNSRPYLEYDAILTLFGKEHGIVTLLAKGARRPQSRKSGILRPFCSIRFDYLEPKGVNGMSRLLQAEATSSGLLQVDPLHLFIAEVAMKFSREGQGNHQFFALLQAVAATTGTPERMTAIFLVKTFTVLGYFPMFGACSRSCGKFTGSAYWQNSGELFCDKHPENGVLLQFPEIKTLAFWQKADFETSMKVDVSQETLGKIFSFMVAFMEREHDLKLKTKMLVPFLSGVSS